MGVGQHVTSSAAAGNAQELRSAAMFFAIMCTYRRPSEAVEYLRLLEEQTLVPDVLVIVDNSPDNELQRLISNRRRTRTEYRYVHSGSNIGPAGAFRRGFDEIRPELSPIDVVAHFDDDDPPVASDHLERLVRDLQNARTSDARVAGVGLSGGSLSRWTGFVTRADRANPLAPVDHLHGGYLPVFSADALIDVGSHDPTFFYGFEELELGRRLTQNGWKLLVDNELMGAAEPLYPKRSSVEGARSEGSWSRFHKERNLVRILRREQLWVAVVVTVVTRHFAKPLVLMLRHPRGGWGRLVLGWRATIAGLRAETGIDPRYQPMAAPVSVS